MATIFSLLILFGNFNFAKAGGSSTAEISPTASHALKQYMAKFGTLMAGLEILKVKEKKPDWASIDLTLSEMSKILMEMQKTDTAGAYKEYTELLATSLVALKKMSEKKDKNIYEGFDKLSNTCFQCHAAHRPADFLKPKGNERISKTHVPVK